MKPLLFAILLGLVALSCQKEEVSLSEPDEITIRTASISRATASDFESGDRIGVWFLNAGAPFTSATGNYKDNIAWQYTAPKWSSSDRVVYPAKDSKLDYYAYYPYQSQATAQADITAYPFAVQSDQRTHASYTQSDFLYASAQGVAANSLDMTFGHKMSRISLNIKLGSEMLGQWPDITAIKIGGVATQTTINLATGVVSATPTTLDTVVTELAKELDTDGVTPLSVAAQAIVVPQQVATGADFIVVETPTVQYKYTLTAPMELAGATSYHLNVTLHQKVLNVTSVAVTDWAQGWIHEGVVSRAVAHDFTAYAQTILDFSFTSLHLCYDAQKKVIGLLCREYIPPLRDVFTILYPISDPTITAFPKEGYITETGQKVVFSKIENRTYCEVGEVPPGFTGVYRTIEGNFVFSSQHFILTDPYSSPYLIEDIRPTSTLGIDEKSEESFTYGVVKIGSQIWLKQNLKTSKLRNGYGIRIGKLGNNPTTAVKPDYWYGWFARNSPSCAVYGDKSEGSYLPTNTHRENEAELSALIERREKYGMLYNYHAVNAQDDPNVKIPTGASKEDYKLARKVFDIPSNDDWYNMIQYLRPALRELPTDSEVFGGLMVYFEKVGLITAYSGHIEFVSSSKAEENYKDLDTGISFWSSTSYSLNNTNPADDKAWVWCSTGTPLAPGTTQPDFSCQPRFIREAHAVRLMVNLPQY